MPDHIPDARLHAVVHSRNIDAKNSFKIRLRGLLDVSHLSDSGIVDQNVDPVLTKQLCERTIYGVNTSHVTLEGCGIQVPMPDCLCNLLGGAQVDIECSHSRACSREHFCNLSAYPAAGARNRNYFVVQTKRKITCASRCFRY
jgi:hypothetical protein